MEQKTVKIENSELTARLFGSFDVNVRTLEDAFGVRIQNRAGEDSDAVTVSGEDERVKGGMNVSGEIIVNAEDDAILIPTDALQKDDAGYCVTLESGETRRVTLGVMTDETTQILDGIGVGETVVY